MSNLRAENFKHIESIYTDIKSLIYQCKRLKEKTIASGLQKIATAIRRIVSYQAINQEYWNYIGGAATAMNCLFNLHEWRIGKAVKETLSSLFDRLAAILPDDFQLKLFEAAKEFGWDKKPEDGILIPKTNSPWFSFIKKLATIERPQWLVRVLKRDWVSVFQAKQLNFADALRGNIHEL